MADDPTGTRGVSPLMIFVAPFRWILGAALDGLSGDRAAIMLHNGLFPTRNDTPRRDERESGGFDH